MTHPADILQEAAKVVERVGEWADCAIYQCAPPGGGDDAMAFLEAVIGPVTSIDAWHTQSPLAEAADALRCAASLAMDGS